MKVCIPGAGGQFQYHHDTRNVDDMLAYEKVNDIILGNAPDVVEVQDVGPGSLVIFAGKHSLHRVSPVTESPLRINSILTFERFENQRLNAYAIFLVVLLQRLRKMIKQPTA
jgi:hypothetical protein